MTFTAMRPVEGLSKDRDVSLSRLSPRVLVDFRLEGGLQRLVGVVGAEEIGVADEEALLVVVGVDDGRSPRR